MMEGVWQVLNTQRRKEGDRCMMQKSLLLEDLATHSAKQSQIQSLWYCITSVNRHSLVSHELSQGPNDRWQLHIMVWKECGHYGLLKMIGIPCFSCLFGPIRYSLLRAHPFFCRSIDRMERKSWKDRLQGDDARALHV